MDRPHARGVDGEVELQPPLRALQGERLGQVGEAERGPRERAESDLAASETARGLRDVQVLPEAGVGNDVAVRLERGPRGGAIDEVAKRLAAP